MIDAPRFSIITPVYNPPLQVLESMLASVRDQSLGDWEHCIVDDGSTEPGVRSAIEEAASAEPRIRARFRDAQGGIVTATNDALGMASGEFLAFLDHDDRLEPTALETISSAIDRSPGRRSPVFERGQDRRARPAPRRVPQADMVAGPASMPAVRRTSDGHAPLPGRRDRWRPSGPRRGAGLGPRAPRDRACPPYRARAGSPLPLADAGHVGRPTCRRQAVGA